MHLNGSFLFGTRLTKSVAEHGIKMALGQENRELEMERLKDVQPVWRHICVWGISLIPYKQMYFPVTQQNASHLIHYTQCRNCGKVAYVIEEC